MKRSHIIKKQVLEVEYANREQAIIGQTHLSFLYKQKIARIIESVFDRIEHSVGNLRIDHLELDLGIIDERTFDSELPAIIERELTDLLYKKSQDPRQRDPYPSGFNSKKGDLKHKVSAYKNSESNTSKESNPGQYFELFEYYLKTGQLPWWANQEDFTTLDDLATRIISDYRVGLGSGVLQFLIATLKNKKYTQRLIYQLSDESLEELIVLLLRNVGFSENLSDRYFTTIINDLTAIHSHKALLPVTTINFRAFAWEQLIRFYVTEKLYKKASSIITKYKVPKADYDHSDAFILYILSQIHYRRFGQPSGRSERAMENREFQDLILELQNSGFSQNHVKTSMLRELMSSDTKLPFSAISGNLEKLHDEDSSDSTDRHKPGSTVTFEDEIVIQNAGLAIVAPFLPHFFDHLGLLEDKQFVTHEAAKRGVLILQHLVTSEHTFPEHELCFNKLLCGVEPDEPVAIQIDISEFEKEEIANLLESVAEHWKALKGTSAEGVRRSFLNRTGLLRPQDGSWKLTIERQTIDVLVDRLPWPISVLKHPWMNTMIYVEW